MRIDKLSDEQKTVMLARAMGWKKAEPSPTVMELFYGKIAQHMPAEVWQTSDGSWIPFGLPNFYDESQMALAWRVLNWAAAIGITTQINAVYQYKKGDWVCIIDLLPADAQTAWLDYILRKAIEAGMVADDE